MTHLEFPAAARQAGVSVRTLYRWRAEGLRVKIVDGVVLVRVEHVLAWKRYKALNDPARGYRRRRAVADGVAGAVVSDEARAWVRKRFIAAGGRP